MAPFIITKEDDVRINKDFVNWSKDNTRVASVFTLLAGADIEVLTIFGSRIKILGLNEYLNVEFSSEALSTIFWGSLY